MPNDRIHSGTFEAGATIDGAPVTLRAWRIITSDRETLLELVESLGGVDGKWHGGYELLTARPFVDIVVKDITEDDPTQIAFTLAEHPELGVFSFDSSERTFVQEARALRAKAIARLSLRREPYLFADAERWYTRPAIELL